MTEMPWRWDSPPQPTRVVSCHLSPYTILGEKARLAEVLMPSGQQAFRTACCANTSLASPIMLGKWPGPTTQLKRFPLWTFHSPFPQWKEHDFLWICCCCVVAELEEQLFVLLKYSFFNLKDVLHTTWGSNTRPRDQVVDSTDGASPAPLLVLLKMK